MFNRSYTHPLLALKLATLRLGMDPGNPTSFCFGCCTAAVVL